MSTQWMKYLDLHTHTHLPLSYSLSQTVPQTVLKITGEGFSIITWEKKKER